jgi:hypothetical protein
MRGCAAKRIERLISRAAIGERLAMKKLAAFAFSVSVALGAAGLAAAHDMAAMGSAGAMGGTGEISNTGMMEHHMVLTPVRTPTPADLDHARALLATLHHAMLPYRNYHVALSQGFRIFLPSVPSDVYHFVDYPAAQAEYQGRVDPTRPGSLLYTKKPDGGYTLVGAMYSAPPDYTLDQLNAIVPLGVARWHQHTNICLPDGITINDLLTNQIGANRSDLPGLLPVSENSRALELNREFGVFADGRFGFEGKIYQPQACVAAHGHFIPVIFGWMVHVYPFSGDDLKVAFGMSVPKPTTN